MLSFKKIRLYFLISLVIFFLFLAFFSFKNNIFLPNSDSKKQEKKNVENLYLDIEQNYQSEIFLNIFSENLSARGEIFYQFETQENIWNFDLKEIVFFDQENRGSKSPFLKEKLPLEIESGKTEYILNLNFSGKTDSYLILVIDGYLKIFDYQDDSELSVQEEKFSGFLKNQYRIISKDAVRIRGDYFSEGGQKLLQKLVSETNAQLTEINEQELALTEIYQSSFATDARVEVVYLQTSLNNEYWRKIIEEYRENDCYAQNADLENCLSLDIRTATGKRYCSWLSVVYN